jgi:hypothetical protein
VVLLVEEIQDLPEEVAAVVWEITHLQVEHHTLEAQVIKHQVLDTQVMEMQVADLVAQHFLGLALVEVAEELVPQVVTVETKQAVMRLLEATEEMEPQHFLVYAQLLA